MPGATRFLPVSVSYAGGAAAGARADEHAVTANNRFARVVLSFADLAPPETWVRARLPARLGRGGDRRHRRRLRARRRRETDDRLISVEGLLHFPPDVLVALAGPRLVLASRELNRLRVVPRIVTGQRGGLALVSGRNDRPGACRATCR
ncbi:hypothetical protein [Methylobacterium nodulans]|uniref:hypothetical protein n=1 Tax=Methylobacterium nodulans TaxID=114616 RepID=UPI000161630D|nr:hypothetical protein [Methylobacterium nodulans]